MPIGYCFCLLKHTSDLDRKKCLLHQQESDSFRIPGQGRTRKLNIRFPKRMDTAGGWVLDDVNIFPSVPPAAPAIHVQITLCTPPL